MMDLNTELKPTARPRGNPRRDHHTLGNAGRTVFGLAIALGLGFTASGCIDEGPVGNDGEPCPAIAAPGPEFCPDGRAEQIDNENGCPMWTCVPTVCPVYQIPQCPEGQHVETIRDTNGCNVPRCMPDACPQVAAPPADFCPEGQRIEQYVTPAGCTDFRCVPKSCPVYQIPQCPEGQHVETVVNAQGCNEPVCVADSAP